MNDGFGHAHGRTDRIASSAAPRDMSRCVTMYAAATVTDRLWPKAQWTTHRPPDASHARMNAPVSSKCAEMSAARVSSTLTCMCAKGREGPGPDDDSQGGGRFITDVRHPRGDEALLPFLRDALLRSDVEPRAQHGGGIGDVRLGPHLAPRRSSAGPRRLSGRRR